LDPITVGLLLAAGVVGGAISSLVGGAAIVTYPVLLATGLSPVVATTSNLLALTPGNFLAALYDRTQLPPLTRSFWGMVVASVVGAGIGAGLLLVTPERMFAVLVPLLLGFATVLFAFAGPISRWLRRRAEAAGKVADADKPHPWANSIAALLPVSVYGGYFGAGVGVLLLGVLSIGTNGDYRAANVTKNMVTSLNSMVASVVFVAQGAVSWPHVLIMMAGALGGALLGARLAQVIPHWIMRVVVVVVGAILTVEFAWRYWF
jgi:hypothetical protein